MITAASWHLYFIVKRPSLACKVAAAPPGGVSVGSPEVPGARSWLRVGEVHLRRFYGREESKGLKFNPPPLNGKALQIKGSLKMLFLGWDAEISVSIFVK